MSVIRQAGKCKFSLFYRKCIKYKQSTLLCRPHNLFFMAICFNGTKEYCKYHCALIHTDRNSLHIWSVFLPEISFCSYWQEILSKKHKENIKAKTKEDFFLNFLKQWYHILFSYSCSSRGSTAYESAYYSQYFTKIAFIYKTCFSLNSSGLH